jgi:ferredoxin
VDLSSGNVVRQGIERTGFAATYTRGLEIVMGRLAERALEEWRDPPLVLVRPRVGQVSMFAFNRSAYLIAEGYRATLEALDRLPEPLESLSPGIHPRREVEVRLDRARCVGCGLCAAQYPATFGMASDGKAVVRIDRHVWSPVGDAAVRLCPTEAISASERVAERRVGP